VLRNSRLYPFIDFLISVPVFILRSTSSLLFAMARNKASRNVMMMNHSVVFTVASKAPAFTRSTKPAATIRMSTIEIFLRPNEYERFIR
jgi:hypothetical protein